METWVSAVLGALTGASILAAVAGVAVSLPIVGGVVLLVLVKREWVPFSYTWRSLVRRNVTTAATLLGLVLVVFVLTSVLMLADGIDNTLASSGKPLHVKIFRKSMFNEGQSWLSGEQVQLLSADQSVARDAGGKPLVTSELLVVIWAAYAGARDPDAGANLSVRGVRPESFTLTPPKRLEGRRFKPGVDEIVIGKALIGRFQGAQLGDAMHFNGRKWRVVGVMDHGGTAHDSEIWGEFELLSGVFRRGVTSVKLALKDEAEFSALAQRLTSEPRLNELRAWREAEYWRSLGGKTVEFVQILGIALGLIFSFAAVLGAMNTMYAQVSARTRELGTLRAIGFRPRAVLASVVIESVLLAFLAGVLGVALASLLGRVEFKLTMETTLTQLAYRFHLSPEVALGSVGFAMLLGYAGGLLPALRAARMRVVDAVRAD